MSKPTKNTYESKYSDDGFWKKLKNYALKAGYEVVEKALWLYYAAQSPKTPAWAKATIYGALGYLISPIDALPDLTPIVGYTDDLGVLALAVASVATYIDKGVKKKASTKLKEWFGDDNE